MVLITGYLIPVSLFSGQIAEILQLPSGPGYLEVDSLEKGYHAHLLVMHDSSSWLQSGMLNVKRFFQASTV